MEYVSDGNLLELYKRIYSPNNSTEAKEKCTAAIVYQLLWIVTYLHKNKRVHRDLKLENFMVNLNREHNSGRAHVQIKLIDFGFATKIHNKLDLRLGSP
jgi:serine/threonine protein kinase